MSSVAHSELSVSAEEEQGRVTAEIIQLHAGKTVPRTELFCGNAGQKNEQKTKREQGVKGKSVPHGSIVRSTRLSPPADPHDWPGWFRNPAFAAWLRTARGIQDVFGPEYRTYRNVVARCRSGKNELDPAFSTFRAFLSWAMPNIGRRPSASHTLDWLNSADPVYGPGRVRWADKAQQAENRRSTKRITAPDGTTTIRALSNSTGLKANTIRTRLRRGWSPEEALTGRRVGTRGDPAASPNLWPAGIDTAKHARAFAVFLAALTPEFRPLATRRMFMWAIYVPTARSATEASHRPGAAAWLAQHGETANGLAARPPLPAGSLYQGAVSGSGSERALALQIARDQALIEDWMSSTTGSHEHQCGCLLARHAVALAKFELGWLTKQPAPPTLPAAPPTPSPFWFDATDPGNSDYGDHDPGDE